MREFTSELPSGSMIIIFTLTSRVILQTIRRRIVGSILINIFPLNIIPTMLCPKKPHLSCQASLGSHKHKCGRELEETWIQFGLIMFLIFTSHVYLGRESGLVRRRLMSGGNEVWW